MAKSAINEDQLNISTPPQFDNDTSPATTIRVNRNMMLAECDYTQLADAPVNALAWAQYRQALRDVPNQDGFPLRIELPEQPK